MEKLRCDVQCENINQLLDELEAELGIQKRKVGKSAYIPELPLPKGRLQIICADCLEYMGDKDGEGMTGISHSLCPECLKKAYTMIEDEIPVTNLRISDGQASRQSGTPTMYIRNARGVPDGNIDNFNDISFSDYALAGC